MKDSFFSLEGKVAVVTGGTSGIGRALSLGLADAGADVIATARRKEQVDDTAKEIEARGRQTLRMASDVGDRSTLEALLVVVLERFSKVDILVNCAGMIKRTPTLDLPEAEWTNILNTNLTGTLRACQVFGRHMLERGYGRIVNIASLNSFVALSEVAAYAASKAGVASLTRSLAVEWSKPGVTVNAATPAHTSAVPRSGSFKISAMKIKLGSAAGQRTAHRKISSAPPPISRLDTIAIHVRSTRHRSRP